MSNQHEHDDGVSFSCLPNPRGLKGRDPDGCHTQSGFLLQAKEYQTWENLELLQCLVTKLALYLGEDTAYLLKVVHCKHNPETDPSQELSEVLHS